MSAARPYRSGFCALGHPPDSHRRCAGTYSGADCSCDRHMVPPVVPTTPTGVLVTESAPETDEWFAARRGGITGTDLPKILGMSKYGNALSVWLDKRGELADEAGEAALWGQIFEDPVGREWARRNTTTVASVGVLRHVDQPWLRASLDRLVDTCPDGDGACGLEIKTRSAFVSDQWRDGMPDGVLAQVAWGRLVSGLDHMHVAALIGGQRLVAFRYDRDDVLEQYLIDQARPVWQAVQDGTPPDVAPDADGVLLDLLDQLYRQRDGEREIPAEQAEQWLAQYADGGELEKQGKALKTEAKTALVQLLGDGATGVVDEVPLFTYKPDPTKDTVAADDLRAFKAADPDQYAALRESGLITTTSPRPTFRVKPRKKAAA